MSRRDYAGITAVIVGAVVSLAWGTALIIAALPITDPISESGANLLATIGGILGGAVAAYLGSAIQSRAFQHGREDVNGAAPRPPAGGVSTVPPTSQATTPAPPVIAPTSSSSHYPPAGTEA